MAAHRYWRALGFEAYGSTGLELSEFQLLAASTRVDAVATLTSNIAPDSGSLANLKDDSTATVAFWSASNVRSLVLSWDFGGSAQDVTDVVIGGGSSIDKFLFSLALQYSDDAITWTAYNWGSGVSATGRGPIAWPGAYAQTVSVTRGVWNYSDMVTGYSVTGGATLNCNGTSNSGKARAWSVQSSGIRQFELLLTANNIARLGVATFAAPLNTPTGNDVGASWAFNCSTGEKAIAGSVSAYSTALVLGTVLGVTVDFTTGTLTFYKNGVSLGTAATGLPAGLYPSVYFNPSSTATCALKTSGFTYPIAGASAWDDALAVPLSVGSAGRAPLTALDVPTSASGVVTYGTLNLSNSNIKTRNDFYTGVLGQGIGRISGTVKEIGTPNVPVFVRVRLVRERDFLPVREMWSDPITGAYQFDYVDELQKYTVIAFDHTHTERAVIGDNLTPDIIT